MGTAALSGSIESVRRTAVWLFFRLLLPEPAVEFDDDRKRAFETHYQSMRKHPDTETVSGLSYPISEFLAYLAKHKPVLFHGTTRADIGTFEPREQTDWQGNPTEAVFATKDAALATFFAVVAREQVGMSIRNGGYLVSKPGGGTERRYLFSVSEDTGPTSLFADGTVFLFDEELFEASSCGAVGFDEWYCHQPVAPLGKLAVTPDDFPFISAVSFHSVRESLLRTMLLYRWRIRRGHTVSD